MIIAALDPGPVKSAFVVLDFDGPFSYAGIAQNDRIIELFRNHYPAMRDEQNIHLVIEMVASFGMPVGASIFETCVWIGRFQQAFQTIATFGEVHFMTRMQVKKTICMDSRAKDSNIRQALIDIYGEQGTKKNNGLLYGLSKDMWSAFAILHSYCFNYQIPIKLKEAQFKIVKE